LTKVGFGFLVWGPHAFECSIWLDLVAVLRVACATTEKKGGLSAVYDPRYRLRRPALGESMHEPRPTPGRIDRPAVIRERLVSVPERGETRSRDIRYTRNTANTEQNAPKLIRLIRTPYAQEIVRPGRIDGGRAGWREDRSRVVHGELVREVVGEDRVPRWPNPTRSGRVVQQRARMSSEEWLANAPSKETSE